MAEVHRIRRWVSVGRSLRSRSRSPRRPPAKEPKDRSAARTLKTKVDRGRYRALYVAGRMPCEPAMSDRRPRARRRPAGTRSFGSMVFSTVSDLSGRLPT